MDVSKSLGCRCPNNGASPPLFQSGDFRAAVNRGGARLTDHARRMWIGVCRCEQKRAMLESLVSTDAMFREIQS